jgi:hypothetical protein
MGIVSYASCTIAFFLFFKSPEREHGWLTYLIGLICYISLPGLVRYIATRDKEKLGNPELEDKYGVLYTGLKRETQS